MTVWSLTLLQVPDLPSDSRPLPGDASSGQRLTAPQSAQSSPLAPAFPKLFPKPAILKVWSIRRALVPCPFLVFEYEVNVLGLETTLPLQWAPVLTSFRTGDWEGCPPGRKA